MHAPRQPRPVLATLVTRDEGAARELERSGSVDAVTEARRVVEPDLLWIESVTDRLLGTAGRPAAWERVYFEDRDIPAPGQADEPPGRPEDEPPADSSQGGAPDDADQAEETDGRPLPQRTPRAFAGPVSYRQPAAYIPAATLDPLADAPPVDGPAGVTEDHGVSEADPEHQEPPLSAEPSPVDLAPTGPRLEQVPPPSLAEPRGPSAEPTPAETSRTEEMPPAVLRAALRDALPDVLSVPASSGPADAVFGDPRWNLPAEEAEETEETSEFEATRAPEETSEFEETSQPEEDTASPEAEEVTELEVAEETGEAEATGEGGPDLAEVDAERLRAAAAEPATEEVERPFADEPVHEPYFEPAAPSRPRTAPSYAGQGHGFPRSADQLTVADVALRLAFRSEDRELAEAVVRLVARQARERSRLQTAEAYLDAILDEGDAALPGAARLRRILAD